MTRSNAAIVRRGPPVMKSVRMCISHARHYHASETLFKLLYRVLGRIPKGASGGPY